MTQQINYTEVADDLKAAKTLIDTPEKWTKDVNARDADGMQVLVRSEEAVCFCSHGAIQRVTLTDEADTSHRQMAATNLLTEVTPGRFLADYNDNHTHEEVMAVWDKAIAKAEALAVVQNLEAAKAKIEKPENWTQNVFAKDAGGTRVYGTSESAVCYCALGALQAATKRDIAADAPGYLYLTKSAMGSVADYNDSHTHEEVVAMFDRAIRLAKEAAEKV
jgi:hypothetical protein